MVKDNATSKSQLASSAGSGTSPARDETTEGSTTTAERSTRSLFAGAAIGMSWQLALVVLVPIIGGYEYDQKHHMTPLWTIVGLVIAMVGSVLVIRRALSAFNEAATLPTKDSDTENNA